MSVAARIAAELESAERPASSGNSARSIAAIAEAVAATKTDSNFQKGAQHSPTEVGIAFEEAAP